MPGVTGWDRGIGTLLGLWLRNQAQRNEEETLRKLLEEQQRKIANAPIEAGIQQGPVAPNIPAPPPPQRSFLEALTQAPQDILQGATGGPPDLAQMREQYKQGAEDLARQQTLGTWIQQQQLENKMPLSTAKEQEAKLQAEKQKELQDMILQRQKEITGMEIGSREKIANMPAKMTPLEQFKLEQYRAHPELLGGIGGGKPVVRQIGDNLSAIIPGTGQVIWSTPNPKKMSPRDLAIEHVAKGEPLPGFSMAETKKIAMGSDLSEAAMLGALIGVGGATGVTPATPGTATTPPKPAMPKQRFRYNPTTGDFE